MSESIGAITGAGGAHAMHAAVAAQRAAAAVPAPHAAAVAQTAPGDALLSRLQVELSQARALGLEAERAASALRSGASTDVEGVLLATRKADAAFQMLQAVRNAMLDAYAQMRDLRA